MTTIAISQVTSERIDKALALANGKRRTRTLSRNSVNYLIERVSDGGYDYSTGGTVPNAYNYPAVTTICMAANVDGKVYVGIGEANAHKCTPGRLWACLQPFGKGSDELIASKLREWIKSSDVFVVE